jgi:hypothetical protein
MIPTRQQRFSFIFAAPEVVRARPGRVVQTPDAPADAVRVMQFPAIAGIKNPGSVLPFSVAAQV